MQSLGSRCATCCKKLKVKSAKCKVVESLRNVRKNGGGGIHFAAGLRQVEPPGLPLRVNGCSNPKEKKKNGGGGIRTPGTLRYNGFQDRRFQPLSHSSGLFI